jgi:hypothetical protein
MAKKVITPKQDTINLAKALRSPKALAAQKIAAAVRPRPMGLKTDSASNMVKALTSPKAKAMRDSTLKAYVAKTGRMPMGLKVDSTKKVTPGGGTKPSIIKKETKIKGVKPITKKFIKKMQAWDKLPKVEYKPIPKK